jgi:hypothetical protein
LLGRPHETQADHDLRHGRRIRLTVP